MRVVAIWIEHSLDVAVKRLHHADPGVHQKIPALCDRDQDFAGSLPFLKFLFGFRRFQDVPGGVLQRHICRPRGSGIGSSNGVCQPSPILPRIVFTFGLTMPVRPNWLVGVAPTRVVRKIVARRAASSTHPKSGRTSAPL
jgi:hypothetical protein